MAKLDYDPEVEINLDAILDPQEKVPADWGVREGDPPFRSGRGEARTWFIDGKIVDNEHARLKILAALHRIESELAPDAGVSMTALADYMGLIREDRLKLSNQLGYMSKETNGGRRGALVWKIGKGLWRTTISGRRGIMKGEDEYAQVVIDLARANGGIIRMIRLRELLGFRRHVKMDFDTSDLKRLEFLPYERACQNSPRIGRQFGVEAGVDGYVSLLPQDMDSTVLSGWSHAVIMRYALKAFPQSYSAGMEAEIIQARRAEGFERVGEALRFAREAMGMELYDVVSLPGVADELLTVDHAGTRTSNLMADLSDILVADGIEVEQSPLEMLLANRTRPNDPLKELRVKLRREGLNPRLAGAIITLEELEQGNVAAHLQAPASLFVVLAKGFNLHGPALSRGLVELGYVGVDFT